MIRRLASVASLLALAACPSFAIEATTDRWHFVPLLNTFLIGVILVVVIVAVSVFSRRSKTWTGMAQSTAIDSIRMEQARQIRAAKMGEMAMNGLRHEVGQLRDRISEAHSRTTTMDESFHNKLALLMADMNERFTTVHARFDDLAATLTGLACAENEWHNREKPGCCPLHKQACPLNGDEKEKESA